MLKKHCPCRALHSPQTHQAIGTLGLQEAALRLRAPERHVRGGVAEPQPVGHQLAGAATALLVRNVVLAAPVGWRRGATCCLTALLVMCNHGHFQ